MAKEETAIAADKENAKSGRPDAAIVFGLARASGTWRGRAAPVSLGAPARTSAGGNMKPSVHSGSSHRMFGRIPMVVFFCPILYSSCSPPSLLVARAFVWLSLFSRIGWLAIKHQL